MAPTVVPTPTDLPAPDEITHDQFTALLNEYPPLVDKISKSKGSKPGQKSLQQLDEYRYGKALADFSDASPSPREMTLDDVRLLVEWKLRHGKFRPMLLGLAASNHAPLARKTIAAAISAYRSPSSPSDDDAARVAAALAALSKLRGIGPATASLLLSVHDPARVVFFSDEAFYWLCAARAPKYTAAEYATLRRNAAGLAGRLGVSATDVEKVAYVLFKREGAAAAAAGAEGGEEAGEAAEKAEKKKEKAPKQKKVAEPAPPAKAKQPAKAKKAAEVKKAKLAAKNALDALNAKYGKPTPDTKGVKKGPAKRKSAAREDESADGARRSKRVKK